MASDSRSEAEIQAEAKLMLSSLPGVRCHRNNVGKFKDRRGVWVEYGLGVGSSDLVVTQSIIVTPAMVGRRVCLFRPVEVKRPGEPLRPEQRLFHEYYSLAGAFPIVWTGPESIKDF